VAVRAGRRVGKTFGTVSLHTLASTVERGAWRNVDPAITAHLLRAIANARGNIPQHLSTARQRLTGGTGSITENTGETFSFDDIGKP
jgi:hypothetical protein